MGCGSSGVVHAVKAPEPPARPPGATASSALAKPPLVLQDTTIALSCEVGPAGGASLPGEADQEALADFNEPPSGSAALRASSAADSRAGPPALRSPREAAISAAADASVPLPPPPMAPRVAVTPPMAVRPSSPAPWASPAAHSPAPSSPARTFTGSGCFEDYLDSSGIVSVALTGFNSPRPFDEPQFPRHSQASSSNLSTASSTPRRFLPVSPSLRGLRSTAEEDILDLFEENEGLMSNIHEQLTQVFEELGSPDDYAPRTRKSAEMLP